jgi:hypothetical protein
MGRRVEEAGEVARVVEKPDFAPFQSAPSGPSAAGGSRAFENLSVVVDAIKDRRGHREDDAARRCTRRP